MMSKRISPSAGGTTMKPLPVVVSENASPPEPPVAAPAGETFKPGWGECPPRDLPLRVKRPAISERTGLRLIRFAVCQPREVGEWVLARADAYVTRDRCPLVDAENMAALDLLAWQGGGAPDKEVLGRLPAEGNDQAEARRPATSDNQ